jgi:soluble lytic murein transglycosylase-like protein
VAAATVAPAEAAILDQYQPHIAEASQRFGIPESWVRAVVMAESNGNRQALSPKGAMGLMQLMPDTWDELRDQQGLRADPYQPRANILAGTAYLRAMHDRFGYPGLFAAYNAGPGRYEEHLRAGRPLPRETRAYVARIESALANTSELAVDGAVSPPANAGSPAQIASGTRLFFTLSTLKSEAENARNSAPESEIFVPVSTRSQHEE